MMPATSTPATAAPAVPALPPVAPAPIEAAKRAAEEAIGEEKARAEAVAKDAATKSEEETRRNAERVESELRLSYRDRQKLQVALTSQGFDVGAIDGSLGPRSRQMISAWQTKKGDAPTGFVTAAQNAALLGEGATAIARWEAAQRRAHAEEQQRRQQQQPPPRQRSGWRWPWE
jgi:peptidoglycan hydrolase-like protein with peptidoglycan-binding domain